MTALQVHDRLKRVSTSLYGRYALILEPPDTYFPFFSECVLLKLFLVAVKCKLNDSDWWTNFVRRWLMCVDNFRLMGIYRIFCDGLICDKRFKWGKITISEKPLCRPNIKVRDKCLKLWWFVFKAAEECVVLLSTFYSHVAIKATQWLLKI